MMYYLYRHIRLDKNEVFYIGYGKGKNYARAFSLYNRNIHWRRIVASSEYEIEILFETDELNIILTKEKEFISLYGRSDKGQGTLCNMTEGGTGGDTFSGRTLTNDHKRKIGDGNRRRVWGQSSLDKMSKTKRAKNIKLSDEKKQKLLIGLINMSQSARERISQATKNSIWIHNFDLKKNKRIQSVNLNSFIQDGWHRGFKIFVKECGENRGSWDE